jgi:DNA-binding transcriptional LysR family regulator
METDRVRQFLALVETRHLRKAAEAVKMSHGAFHKSLQVLQRDVGLVLYVSEGRGIAITPQGQAFAQRAKEFLNAERVLLWPERKQSSLLRVGTHETLATYLVAPNWHAYLPDQELLCRELLPGRLEDAVELGNVDVGLTYEHVPRPGLDAVDLGRIGMGIYALRNRFRGIEFARLPFVAPATPMDTVPSQARGLDGWPDFDIPRLVVFRTDLLATALSLVGAGQCAIFIPHFVASAVNSLQASDKRLAQIERPGRMKKVTRSLRFIRRTGSAETGPLRQLARLVRTEGSRKGDSQVISVARRGEEG